MTVLHTGINFKPHSKHKALRILFGTDYRLNLPESWQNTGCHLAGRLKKQSLVPMFI
jgi:hypothetical protein